MPNDFTKELSFIDIDASERDDFYLSSCHVYKVMTRNRLTNYSRRARCDRVALFVSSVWRNLSLNKKLDEICECADRTVVRVG